MAQNASGCWIGWRLIKRKNRYVTDDGSHSTTLHTNLAVSPGRAGKDTNSVTWL